MLIPDDTYIEKITNFIKTDTTEKAKHKYIKVLQIFLSIFSYLLQIAGNI